MPVRVDMKEVLSVILAGGRGTRLEPLTRDRAKPAVHFGGIYRIIDFSLSNCLNSGIRKTLVFTQYKAMSLDRHISLGWQGYLSRELGEFIDVVPPQQRIDEHWYQGTADAVYQNIYTIEKERPAFVVILAGDHIYKMDYLKLLERHLETQADLTVGALRVDVRAARISSASCRSTPTSASSVSRRSRTSRSRSPAIPTTPWPRWAFMSSRRDSSSSNSASTPRATAASTISAATSFPSVLGSASRLRLSLPRREPQEGRLLARRGHAGRLLRGEHGPHLGRSATEPLRPPLADPHVSAEPAAAEVRFRRAGLVGPPRPGVGQPRLRRARSFPADRSSVRSSGRTPASTATPRSRTRFFSTG